MSSLVPNFRILGTLGLLDTQWALVLPAMFAPLGTFLMTQSFRAVPDEILEAAQLDGASMGTVLWRILVPSSKNGLACVIVLTFLEAWNMVEQPMAYLKDSAQYPLSVSLATTGARDQAVQLACCLLALLPPLLLFLGLHKELVQGIALHEDWAGESRHRGFSRALAITLAILVECTILSGMISREMAIQVTVASPRHDQERATDSLPLDAFRQEEDGTFLYLLEEGTGLLGSTQLRRVSTDILSLEGERAFTTGLEQRGSYVVYASRPLEDEEWAVETVPSDPAPDTYLLWAPEGIELDAPSASAEGGTLYLLPQEEAPQPFLEERELAALFPGEERRNCRLFSLGDVEQFARQLPLLGGVGVLALAPLACCAWVWDTNGGKLSARRKSGEKLFFHLMFSSNPRSLGAGIFLFRLTSVLKDPVVLQQFVKGDRLIAVDIHPGVEHVVPGSQEWPEVRTGVIVDMAVDHVRLFGVLPGEQRVMAQGQGVTAVGEFQHQVNTGKIAGNIHFRHPRPIVIPNQQPLFSL